MKMHGKFVTLCRFNFEMCQCLIRLLFVDLQVLPVGAPASEVLQAGVDHHYFDCWGDDHWSDWSGLAPVRPEEGRRKRPARTLA